MAGLIIGFPVTLKAAFSAEKLTRVKLSLAGQGLWLWTLYFLPGLRPVRVRQFWIKSTEQPWNTEGCFVWKQNKKQKKWREERNKIACMFVCS